MTAQGESKTYVKFQRHVSVRGAALWAVKVSLACNGLLVVVMMVLGSRPGITDRVNPPDWILPGFELWNVVLGGAWHSMLWLFCSLALNIIVYFALIFAAEGIFLLWKRWLHAGDNELHIR
jgi:fucose 4-O-acetylase-like acetyltransferase